MSGSVGHAAYIDILEEDAKLLEENPRPGQITDAALVGVQGQRGATNSLVINKRYDQFI